MQYKEELHSRNIPKMFKEAISTAPPTYSANMRSRPLSAMHSSNNSQLDDQMYFFLARTIKMLVSTINMKF